MIPDLLLLTDASVDRRHRRGAFFVGLSLVLLFVSLIGGILLLHLAPSHLPILAPTGLFLVIMSLWLGFLAYLQADAIDQYSTLESRPVMLVRTLKLLAASEAARRRCDQILASGRRLRVFDVADLHHVAADARHADALHRLYGSSQHAPLADTWSL